MTAPTYQELVTRVEALEAQVQELLGNWNALPATLEAISGPACATCGEDLHMECDHCETRIRMENVQ